MSDGRNLILLTGDRSSCAGGWEKEGREKLCNCMATATPCSWGGCAGCSRDADVGRGGSNHLHSLPPQYSWTWLGASRQPTSSHCLFCAVLCWCRNPVFKTTHWILFWILILPRMGGLLLMFLQVSYAWLSQPVFCLHPIILLIFALRLVLSQTLLVWDLVTSLGGVYHPELQVISAVNWVQQKLGLIHTRSLQTMSGLIPAVSLRSCISPAISDAVTSFLVHRFRQTQLFFWIDLDWFVVGWHRHSFLLCLSLML